MFPYYSHPFMNKLSINQRKEKTFILILYRLNFLNNKPFVEFYLNDVCFQKVNYKNEDDLFEKINVNGKKNVMGTLNFQNRDFIFVQLKNNKTQNENWVVLYDVIINKGKFCKKFDPFVIEFFLQNHKIADIYLENKLCIAPCVYYMNIDNSSVLSFIKRTNLLLYSNKSPFLELYPYSEKNNICCLCFHDDNIYNSSCNSEYFKKELFSINEYDKKENSSAIFIKDDTPRWIFKNQTDILFFIK